MPLNGIDGLRARDREIKTHTHTTVRNNDKNNTYKTMWRSFRTNQTAANLCNVMEEHRPRKSGKERANAHEKRRERERVRIRESVYEKIDD